MAAPETSNVRPDITVTGPHTTDNGSSSNRPSGKRIVLTTFGSYGDIHPYMAIALELKARGHFPAIATSEMYRKKIEDEGIGFHGIRPNLPDHTQPEAVAAMMAEVMDAQTGTEYLFKHLLMPPLRDSYADLKQAIVGADLLVTHMITFAGPILAQQTGIKWVSTVLAPITFWSLYDPSAIPQLPIVKLFAKLGPSGIRALVRVAKWKSKEWVEAVYALRQELGMPPGEHPIFEGQHSPELVLALFSPLLGAPQQDWPPQTRCTGFCFYDRSDGVGMAPELERFLQAGPPPIVFTLGSAAVYDARNFFQESIIAAQELKQRAVLLIGDMRNLPSTPLPDGIVAYEYAPYSELLPRAAVTVHQGGVGTTGQALRAGKPMLIMPFSHDQPDNAARMTRLGVARTLPRHRYRASSATIELGKLLNDPAYAQKATEVGRQVQAENGAEAACDALEECLLARK